MARSSLVTPSLRSDTRSVLAKTPQREAMGCMALALDASVLSPWVSVCSNVAIWSMKAPVPPAQASFMRRSTERPK